jgi:hypothetical protein
MHRDMQHKLLGLTQVVYVLCSWSVSQQVKILILWVTHHLEVLVNISIAKQCGVSFKVEME